VPDTVKCIKLLKGLVEDLARHADEQAELKRAQHECWVHSDQEACVRAKKHDKAQLGRHKRALEVVDEFQACVVGELEKLEGSIGK
jgi:phenylalanyl-tRNA synthetase beta subunit